MSQATSIFSRQLWPQEQINRLEQFICATREVERQDSFELDLALISELKYPRV